MHARICGGPGWVITQVYPALFVYFITVLAPRSSGKENHLNVKPFVETLRVTNPVRQSRASSRKRVLRGGG